MTDRRNVDFGNDRGTNPGVIRGALVLAAAAVLGVVLLQRLDDAPKAQGAPRITVVTQPTVPSSNPTETTIPSEDLVESTVSATPPRNPAEVKVLAANATGRAKIAARVSGVLSRAGYATVTPKDTITQGAKSQVLFQAGYETDARAVANFLGVPSTDVSVAIPPLPVRDSGGANVIVVVGSDMANKYQNEPLPGVTTATTTATTTAPAAAPSAG